MTVDKLLKMQKLKNLRVIAGHSGLDRTIASVSIMDAPDSYKWLNGGEFILTSGFIFGDDIWQVEHFVCNLIEADCSAVGIKKGRFLTIIPETVIELANKQGFPIIEIPYSFGWSYIISEFYRLQYTKNVDETKDIIPINSNEQNEMYIGYFIFRGRFLCNKLKPPDSSKWEKPLKCTEMQTLQQMGSRPQHSAGFIIYLTKQIKQVRCL